MFEIKATILGACGQEHATFEEWQQCKACDAIAEQHNRHNSPKADILKFHGDAMWNAAIEEAAKEADKLSDHIGNGLSDRIRKLNK